MEIVITVTKYPINYSVNHEVSVPHYNEYTSQLKYRNFEG